MPGWKTSDHGRDRRWSPARYALPVSDSLAPLLDGLNDAQRRAALAVRGPVAIQAGAGTGKTTTIVRRTAVAVASGAADPRTVLLVTFTEKAAGELAERIAALGMPRVTARTFHSAALAQLRHFWPRVTPWVREQDLVPRGADPAALPAILDNPYRIVGRLVRSLPGGYAHRPAKDLVTEIGWARSRGLDPETYPGAAAGREPPVPLDLFLRVFRGYARAKRAEGAIDFDDMLTLTAEILAAHPDLAAEVRARYAWFCVDEYQDTNRVQQRLLDTWLGERDDICVVGDEDQTIYSFAGASPDLLAGFGTRYPGAIHVALRENHRSTPEILTLANRLIGATGRAKDLVATRPSGAWPEIRDHADDAAEAEAIARTIATHLGRGTAPGEIAVLVRLGAQLPPIEDALRRARIPFRVRGRRFFERPEVRTTRAAIAALPAEMAGPALARATARLLADATAPLRDAPGAEAREQLAALETLATLVHDHLAATPDARPATIVADLDARAGAEASAGETAVVLSTLHAAKGLEWDVVLLPGCAEGLLPVAQSLDDPAAIAEERRLLYVGITRARDILVLSWARRRADGGGRPRQPSRFLADLRPSPIPGRATGGTTAARSGAGAAAGMRGRARPAGETTSVPVTDPDALPPEAAARFAALRSWRATRASADGVPAYVVGHNATIAAIALADPATPDALGAVPGMGPARVARYGPEILAVLAAARD